MNFHPGRRALVATTLLLAAFVTAQPAAADETIPKLNIEPSCHVQAAMQSDKQVGFERCMEQEQTAKVRLEQTWAQYDLEDRAQCLDITNELGGDSASYVEVLECVVMSSDARKFEKSFPANEDVMVGQGRGD
jgi:hypothetical protein